MDAASRKGLTTSEFWLIVAFFGVVIINGTAFVNVPPSEMTMLAAAAFGYTGGRTILKNNLAKGVA